MPRYIDAEKIEYFALSGYGLTNKQFAHKPQIEEIPTADVAPVVRCAECKFFNRGDETTDGKCRCDYDKLWQLSHFRPYRKFDDFCSHGAKMDEEEEPKK